MAPQLNRRSFFWKKLFCDRKDFDLEHKSIFFFSSLYKIISGVHEEIKKYRFFVIMVRDWRNRFNNFKVVAVPCFVHSRTILTKISIFNFPR